MLKRVAFIFSSMPYGRASALEGLNALLAFSVLSDDIGVFFISDGVFLLLSNQCPDKILSKDFISGFEILPLCDNVCSVYLCSESAYERGLTQNMCFKLEMMWLSPKKWRKKLLCYDLILKF